ncbi:MAG: 1-acyl-sn-glycerol-3-phosphate acyltransferase, partial [Planctomycetota bacterium]|nr:1-acyl-sn-glycerol-3-phosphate acyltransferase [Planctomycetota bacterium]
MYGLIRTYGRAMVGSWYRVEAHGEALPEQGAMILYANHNGGLVDGGLMWFLTRRQLRFIAKYTLLKMPLLGLLIRAAGTIPVYRKKDKVDTSLNQSSFAAIDAALLAGEAIVLYPEGEGGTEPFVRPFKTGTARMALSALAASGSPLDLQLVPVGITYEDQDRYRSVLHATVGKAVRLDDLAEGDAQPATVARATARIQAALRALLPEHEFRDQVAASRLAAELVPARGRTLQERMRAVVAGLARLREAAPARAARLQEELQRCAQELR